MTIDSGVSSLFVPVGSVAELAAAACHRGQNFLVEASLVA
jgi:hypothetical protein